MSRPFTALRSGLHCLIFPRSLSTATEPSTRTRPIHLIIRSVYVMVLVYNFQLLMWRCRLTFHAAINTTRSSHRQQAGAESKYDAGI